MYWPSRGRRHAGEAWMAEYLLAPDNCGWRLVMILFVQTETMRALVGNGSLPTKHIIYRPLLPFLGRKQRSMREHSSGGGMTASAKPKQVVNPFRLFFYPDISHYAALHRCSICCQLHDHIDHIVGLHSNVSLYDAKLDRSIISLNRTWHDSGLFHYW